ncbi:MAG: phosphatase PAP2 family protein [Chlamydiales bacterium]|nr:phosphatase PAP2 family protein [Chlamydiales bacterium]
MKKFFLVLFFLNFSLCELRASGFEKYGDIGEYAIPLSALLMTFLNNDLEGHLQGLAAYGTSVGSVAVMKHWIDARRPNGGKDSFPSGHTAGAFAGAAFVQRRYGWNYGVFAYAAAGLVGVSRIDAKKHWMRDVVAGAAIGILSNVVFTTPYRKCSIEISSSCSPDALTIAAQFNIPL